MEKTWQPNETQNDFMKVLENYPDGASLKDIELDTGKAFKTGSINVLIGKGMVAASTELQVLHSRNLISSVVMVAPAFDRRTRGRSLEHHGVP